MPIVQVSQIKHRRGLQENLPQLGSAEFGWSIDRQRLFIGSGTREEGAPTEENIEVITETSPGWLLIQAERENSEIQQDLSSGENRLSRAEILVEAARTRNDGNPSSSSSGYNPSIMIKYQIDTSTSATRTGILKISGIYSTSDVCYEDEYTESGGDVGVEMNAITTTGDLEIYANLSSGTATITYEVDVYTKNTSLA